MINRNLKIYTCKTRKINAEVRSLELMANEEERIRLIQEEKSRAEAKRLKQIQDAKDRQMSDIEN